MRVQLSARHCEIPDAVRARAEDRVARLTRYDPRLSSAEVVFEIEKHLHKVEAVLSIHGDGTVVAKGEGPDFRIAVDQLVDRLAKVLRRRRSQVTDHQASRPASEPEVVSE